MSHLPPFVIVGCCLAIPVGAQPAPRTTCRNAGATITCTNLAPVSETQAAAILTGAIAPFVLPHPPVFVPPVGSNYVGAVRGEVFSDRWPYAAAGVYPWVAPGILTAPGTGIRRDALSPRWTVSPRH
jgi:hypothetical protein